MSLKSIDKYCGRAYFISYFSKDIPIVLAEIIKEYNDPLPFLEEVENSRIYTVIEHDDSTRVEYFNKVSKLIVKYELNYFYDNGLYCQVDKKFSSIKGKYFVANIKERIVVKSNEIEPEDNHFDMQISIRISKNGIVVSRT